MGHDGACPSIGLDGAPLSAPNRIIDEQQTQRDGEQVEETIVPRRRDCDLEKKNRDARNRRIESAFRPKPPWREKDRQEAHLNEEDIPLKTEKCLAGDCERKIKSNQPNE